MRTISGIFITILLGCGTSGTIPQDQSQVENSMDTCLGLYGDGQWGAVLECMNNIPESQRDQAFYDLQGSARMQSSQFQEAVLDFERALALDTAGRNPFLYYKLGESQWQNNQYLDAGEAMLQYQEAVANPRPDIRQKVEYYLRSAALADSLYQEPRQFEAVMMSDSINSDDEELGISMTFDRKHMIFTRRSDQEDIYESYFQNGSWSRATPISVLNTPDNEGAVSLSGDGQLLVFTACNRPENIGSCDLYFSAFSDTGWTRPELMPVINTPGWESQPTLSPDGRVVIFSSDRPGGYGGRDLWLSVLGEEGWMSPMNLGPTINSPGNEENPFLHTNQNTLYFTSDYWPGFGGRDLFMSHRLRGNEWTVGENLGYPINSIRHEEGIFVTSSGERGYFASARRGNFDLYTFEVDPGIRPQPSYLYQMVVVDEATEQPIVAANVDVYDWTGNRLTRSVTTDRDGYAAFLMVADRQYGITISKSDFAIFSYQKIMGSTLDHDLTDTIRLETIPETQTLILENVHFETGKATLLAGSESELNQVAEYLLQHSDFKIQLTGHTDNVGSAEDNLILSSARAQTVKDYLVEQGVDLQRIEAEGKGESHPVASNDTSEGRQKNRRTELTILK